jgi:hypothetical protein
VPHHAFLDGYLNDCGKNLASMHMEVENRCVNNSDFISSEYKIKEINMWDSLKG